MWNRFVNSFGYVNLFPFVLKLVPPSSEKLGYILNRIRNEVSERVMREVDMTIMESYKKFFFLPSFFLNSPISPSLPLSLNINEFH